MVIFKKILFLSLLFALLSTCKKSDFNLECTDANTVKSPKDALDYFYFKEGTWWLYREDSTGLTDSVWVSHSTMNSENPTSLKRACGCGHGKCVQNILIIFENRLHNSSLGEHLNGISIGPTNFDPTQGDVTEGSDYCFLGSGVRMSFLYSHFKSPTDQGSILENLDSIKVAGHFFKNIIHQYYPNQNNIPDWLHESWYARGIYLIKYKKYDGTNWSLIDYHIVK